MRVAVVHDDLMRRGGAEQVVLSMMMAFPNADLFTMCYQPELTYPEFKKYKIQTSLFQSFVKTERAMKWFFFPLGIICMKLLKVQGYDVVIISTTFCGKYVSIDKKATVFIYTYTPFRLAWNPTSYSEYDNSKGVYRFILNCVIRILRYVDKKEAQKGDFHIGMTKETAERIKEAYNVKDVCVIHPAVKSNNFYINKNNVKNYYLIVSRLEFYKKVDIAVNAFNELNLPLVIVGNGSKKSELIALAKNNIEFKTGLSIAELAELYANCKALIFPQYEDYGITPLEANASGRPVIAYAKGGVLETMIPYDKKNENQFTSVFFKKQDKESLIEAIQQLENLEINTEFIKNHSLKFDESVFVNELLKTVNSITI